MRESHYSDHEFKLGSLSFVSRPTCSRRNPALKLSTDPRSVHGFTIRGDLEDGKEKSQKEDANNAALAFVKKAFGA